MTGPGGTLIVRPQRLVLVGRAVAVLVVGVFGVLALLLPRGEVDGVAFGPADQVAFFLIGCLIAAVPLAFTRARVSADERGVWVRNGLGEKFLPWAVVVGVEMPEGAPWAHLELQDDETVALLAVQSNDGDRAVDAVLALRRALRQARGTG
ncbi:MAG: PH domain-containing protein [Actinomycetota bacterium]|nr:PH domain-containing protein [Actinomycetota bacterium]